MNKVRFQSPRTGKFESNVEKTSVFQFDGLVFQSPRTGKFESNVFRYRELTVGLGYSVSIP